MIKAAEAISGFLPSGQKESAPTIEEPVFILTSGQLKAIIAEAIQEATRPLIERLSAAEAMLSFLPLQSEGHRRCSIS